ncbi:MAG: hypothetical protein KDE35_17420 [Geminicoccaceae bacterium]|nr:hypothetical protein [Geminicoccaceae bacterium]
MVLDRLAAPLPQPPGAPPPPLDRRLGGPEPSAASSRRSRTDEAAAADRADIGYTAMLTAGDVVYALWSIDPRVVEAAAFAHLTKGDGPVPLDDIVQRLGDATPAAARGISSALQGFTAEQWVRLNLAAEGHVVEMPAEHFTPGYDIVVDDQAFQIKCGESRTMLAEHFDRYPDIPVIANVELLDGIEREDWASMVFTVDGFDLDTVRSIIADSLEAAGTLGDLPLPLYAVLVGCVRRMHDIYTGRMALATLPGHLLVEAAVRGSLSWLGAKAAATAGLVLLGPAGAVILGPTGGIAALVGVSGVRRRLEETLSPRWAKRVVSSARRVHRSACTVLDRRLALHRRHHPAEPPDDPLRRWLHARRDDEWVTVAEQRVLLDETPCGTVADALELIDRTASLRILDPEFRRAQRDLLLALQDEEPVPERVQDGFHRVGRWSQGLWTAVRPGGDGRRAGGSNRDEC